MTVLSWKVVAIHQSVSWVRLWSSEGSRLLRRYDPVISTSRVRQCIVQSHKSREWPSAQIGQRKPCASRNSVAVLNAVGFLGISPEAKQHLASSAVDSFEARMTQGHGRADGKS